MFFTLFLLFKVNLVGQSIDSFQIKRFEKDIKSLEKEYDIKKFHKLQTVYLDSIANICDIDKKIFLMLYYFSTRVDNGIPDTTGKAYSFINATIEKSKPNSSLFEFAMDAKIARFSGNTDDAIFKANRIKELDILIKIKHDKIIKENLLYYEYLVQAGDIEFRRKNINKAILYYNKVFKMNFWDIDNDTHSKYAELYQRAGGVILACYRGDLEKLQQLHFYPPVSYGLEQIKKIYIEELGGKYELYQKN